MCVCITATALDKSTALASCWRKRLRISMWQRVMKQRWCRRLGVSSFAGVFRYNSNERILRYPNGDIRRIRYPIIEISDAGDDQEPILKDMMSKSEMISKSCCHLKSESPNSSSDIFEDVQSSVHKQEGAPKAKEFPNSPLDLLKYLQSEEYQEAQKRHKEEIKNSYKVLEGCPWIEPRQIFILALDDVEGRSVTYTLRTKVSRGETTDELFKLFRGEGKRKREEFLTVSHVVDGIITFSREVDAKRYLDKLEAENDTKADLCDIDSHDLFRGARESKAVVVLVDGDKYLPSPSELTTELKDTNSLEDFLSSSS